MNFFRFAGFLSLLAVAGCGMFAEVPVQPREFSGYHLDWLPLSNQRLEVTASSRRSYTETALRFAALVKAALFARERGFSHLILEHSEYRQTSLGETTVTNVEHSDEKKDEKPETEPERPLKTSKTSKKVETHYLREMIVRVRMVSKADSAIAVTDLIEEAVRKKLIVAPSDTVSSPKM